MFPTCVCLCHCNHSFGHAHGAQLLSRSRSSRLVAAVLSGRISDGLYRRCFHRPLLVRRRDNDAKHGGGGGLADASVRATASHSQLPIRVRVTVVLVIASPVAAGQHHRQSSTRAAETNQRPDLCSALKTSVWLERERRIAIAIQPRGNLGPVEARLMQRPAARTHLRSSSKQRELRTRKGVMF